jgi:hypothetical protein
MIPAAFEMAPPREPRRGPRRRPGQRPLQGRTRPAERFALRLWIPLVLVWALLAPFLILLSPLIIVGLAIMRVEPFRAIGVAFAILHGLGGTQVDVETDDAFIKIHLI